MYLDALRAFCRKYHLDFEMMKKAADEMQPSLTANQAPGYQPANEHSTSCATCRAFDNGKCTMFSFQTDPKYTCEEWAG